MDNDELLSLATEFRISPKPLAGYPPLKDNNHFDLRVVWRGDDRWAVTNGFACIGRRGNKAYERMSSSRTERFIKAYRFSREDAVAIALKYVDRQKVNGLTYIEWQRHWGRKAGKP